MNSTANKSSNELLLEACRTLLCCYVSISQQAATHSHMPMYLPQDTAGLVCTVVELLRYVTLRYVTSCYVMSCHVMSCHVMSYHDMSCYVMSCYIVLCCAVLCCVVLCCVVLCCVALLQNNCVHLILCSETSVSRCILMSTNLATGALICLAVVDIPFHIGRVVPGFYLLNWCPCSELQCRLQPQLPTSVCGLSQQRMSFAGMIHQVGLTPNHACNGADFDWSILCCHY